MSDKEYEEIDKLEFYLDEIPDYLAKELTSEYSRLKLEFSNRGRTVVKIERNPVPPPSLAVEKQKATGVYNKSDVILRLKEDSHDKCYICELGGLSDPEVEHLKPHHGRTIPERVFDWNNLFYVCPHCNNIKKESKYDDKIIDCCEEDPEKMLEQCYEEGHVNVHNIVNEERAIMTADLIQECFEKRNTGIREAACQHRIDRLAEEMNFLYKTLEKHKRSRNATL